MWPVVPQPSVHSGVADGDAQTDNGTLEQACLLLALEPESDRGCHRVKSREDQLSKMSQDCPVGVAKIFRDRKGIDEST